MLAHNIDALCHTIAHTQAALVDLARASPFLGPSPVRIHLCAWVQQAQSKVDHILFLPPRPRRPLSAHAHLALTHAHRAAAAQFAPLSQAALALAHSIAALPHIHTSIAVGVVASHRPDAPPSVCIRPNAPFPTEREMHALLAPTPAIRSPSAWPSR